MSRAVSFSDFQVQVGNSSRLRHCSLGSCSYFGELVTFMNLLSNGM